ncbi:Tripeptidyl-peptidase II protein [Dioscorea alata]|uniref:Tripeptidyl-peptidase II protein n=1 Tax=Dioscorea alata TaxID=55571 RepID=A0ACB7VIE6_DIOAL|nr:Tripeptidyl-peptidase II protein [Dioscorea alata]
MASCGINIQYLLLCVMLARIRQCVTSQVYVVYMGSSGVHSEEVLKQNHEMLAAVHGGSNEKAMSSHVYSYSNGLRGFAAKLSKEQALEIAEMPGVVSVFPNEKRSLHTTHSWDFMGLSVDEQMEIPGFATKNQENVIIGFIDTGIWPESPSFNDHGMPPVPSRWKGECQTGESFTTSDCNKKVIGARYYLNGYESEEEYGELLKKSNNAVKYKSPRDSSGHGSHTASIAAGRYVNNVNYSGLASGEARGGASMARIAVYKTCWESGCYDADILAAFNDAIRDGVDIISMSLGPTSPQGDYFSDAISIGSFHATSHGIMVVSSAGNVGTRGSVTNLAPWMLTVAASSTDRDFSSYVILGNGTKLMGESLNVLRMNRSAGIIPAGEANGGYFTPYQSSFCLESSLNKTKAKGKILICRHSGSSSESRLAKSVVVKRAGGVGMILIDEVESDIAIPFAIPAASVDRRTAEKILSFVNHTRNPRSLILPTKAILGLKPAPRMAAFSSKGPNSLTPGILKPDITAPGLNILAAWSPAVKIMNFNILSGTSMSCPHITGIAALIKAVYPSWSPSAIKSAIMTTATTLDKRGKAITADPTGRMATPFDYGSGFPNPVRVLDPGLVYDAQPADYKAFLCSIGYDDKSLRRVTGDNSTCTRTAAASASDLNYPTITVPELRGSYFVTRTVTNVGRPRSVYQALVSPPAGIQVTVVPKILVFRNYGEKRNFTVSFRATAPSKGYVFGSLTWKTKALAVTSPLVVRLASSNTGLL